ncbi:MAG: 3-methyl-2-oxobutanoate hydroxymethyltransferase [Mariprofundales bacterium]
MMVKVKKINIRDIQRAKHEHQRMSWLTAYDAPSAALAERAGVDVLLVGDSLGMTVLGMDSTLGVCLEDIIRHTKAVMTANNHCWVVADLPFASYQQSPQQAFASAARVLAETSCDAIKLEGGSYMAETISFLHTRGIPVVAHIGLLPQSINKYGGFRKQGNDESSAKLIITDAQAIEQAGATAVVLECVPAALAAKITDMLTIPTVGIGAGSHCDAQVLVWHDLLGLSKQNPPFAPAYAPIATYINDAISRWVQDVKSGKFPEKNDSVIHKSNS